MKRYLPLLALLVGACVQVPDSFNVDDPTFNVAYKDFDFTTVKSSNISVRFQDQTGAPFSGIRIQFRRPSDQEVLLTGVTDAQGKFTSSLALPSYLDQVIIEAGYIGIPNRILVPVKNGEIRLDFLGSVNPDQVISYDVDPALLVDNSKSSISNTIPLEYAASYNSSGLPSNLLPTLDVISANLLKYINASLPEGMPVPTYHPTYLADGKKTTLDIVEEADVWLTFVHEGAGWRNSIGYYVYPTNKPPQSLAEIQKVTILFPNASLSGSGGSLRAGHKVKIGRFSPGVSVGIVLFANGWSGSKVEKYYHAVFADKKLNPEPNVSLKQHNVLLWDEENKLFLLGFEDVRRDDIPFRCDQDFNDAILFVTSNPLRAISTENVSPVDKPGTLDQDGDGINDNLDEYPADPTKAYNTYYPSVSGFGSFAFEDNWPEMGDYDFNDMVVDYQFKHVMNSKNEVVELHPKFKFRAAGAGLRNGFGFSLDSESSSVKSVTGARANKNKINVQANGTEADQTKAVIVVTENVHQLFGVSHFINTEKGGTILEPITLEMKISFTTPIPQNRLGIAPYNPFLIVGQDRKREVHLPGYAPTSLADKALFGTGDDGGKVGQTSSFYKSKTALPWAINIPESFVYPVEKQEILGAHLVFDNWAKSGGFSYMDWYRGQNGYRSTSKLF